MVAESYDIARETYLAILMDRAYQGPVIVGSPKGGVDIEEVAKNTPEHIHKVMLTLHAQEIKTINKCFLLTIWFHYLRDGGGGATSW